MSRPVQGIIVSGEASESDEEEEFCAAQVKGQLLVQRAQQIRAESCTAKQPKLQQQQQQQAVKRTHVSILHQKLWEANASLERNLAQCVRGPMKEQSGRIQHLSGTLSTVQTSTLTTYNALTQASRNLTQIDFLLAGLVDNPLSSLKRLQ
ncbi:uncharacterized protein LOC127003292 [Eriocheir sinensis]|uniref:uncharacterized protein LOC127003292 n=1 Tax=Eriocheir sinensis TaxID=95602 RepID=UPI0021C80AF7|nr:uncharacterized protein LOC127003292 [Eriocheir sinensis]